jgi:CBS domain-containing protein
MEGLAEARWDFNLQPTKNVLNFELGDFAAKNRPMVISNESTMWDAVQYFAQGVKRLIVLDGSFEAAPLLPQQPHDGMLLGLFCQSDVIDFFSSNPYWLRMWPKANQTLKDTGILDQPNEQIQTISQDQPTYEAFKKMVENNSNALAVVDEQGRMVAALSASNIRGISRRNFQLVQRPVYEFLQRDRRRGWWSMPVLAEEGDTLDKLIFKLGSTRVHQAFVVDSQGKPSHIVTLTDIIRLLVPSQSS